MKKLMVLAATLAVAAVTQASSVYWTCSGVFLGNEEDKCSGIAYFVNGADLKQSELLAMCGAADSASKLSTALADNYSWTPTSSGSYLKGSSAAVSVGDLGLKDSTDYAAVYLAIFDGATIADSKNVYLTQTLSLKTLEGDNSAQVKFGAQANSKTASNWTAVGAVPEPTSGLLLLLGVAGLALRRKQK